MSKVKLSFKDDIQKIFQYTAQISLISENSKKGTVDFNIFGRDLTFDKLKELSDLLKTKNINFYMESDGSCNYDHGDGRCYCNNDSIIEVHCYDVNFCEISDLSLHVGDKVNFMHGYNCLHGEIIQDRGNTGAKNRQVVRVRVLCQYGNKDIEYDISAENVIKE